MKKTECYNCEELSHIKRHCKKFKKNSKINSSEKKNDSSDNDKKINKKTRKKKFNDQARKIRQQQAQAVKNDLNSYDDSSSDSKNSEAACLIINKFDDKLSEKACYAAENKNENETAYQVTKMNLC